MTSSLLTTRQGAMADDGRRSADHASPPHVHQVVDEAMRYLDPPPHESLTLDSVAHAYTILQQAAAVSSDASHLRVQEIASIMRHENTIDKDWILAQTDLYRALLLSAFLLLELGSSHHARILQSSVERCLLLLQVLGCELPQSRHSLLQAVLEEPLVPLNKQERHYTYILQRNRNEGDDDDNSDDSLEDENVLSTMDKRQIAQEEQELVKLATRPIPAGGGFVDQDVQQDPSPSISQQGPLVWIRDSANRTPCHVQLHACGILIVYCGDELPHIFYLTHLTTCEPCVDSQSLCIHISTCVSQEMQSKWLEFQADSLSVGYAWVTSLNQVVQELKRGASLQKELHQEWKGEYENVMAKQKASFRV